MSPMPTTRSQLALRRVKEMISAGSPGDRLPSESELAAQIGVSRVTVREALRTLWHEGAIVRRWGAGTFIAEKAAADGGLFRSYYVDSSALGSLPERIAEAGGTPSMAAFLVDRAAPPAWIAREGAGGPLIRVLRCVAVDGRPGVVMEDFIPQGLVGSQAQAEELRDLAVDLPGFLRRHGTRVVKHEGSLSAVLAAEPDAALLHVAPGSPLLEVRQHAVDESGAVAVRSRLLYRADVFAQVLVRAVSD